MTIFVNPVARAIFPQNKDGKENILYIGASGSYSLGVVEKRKCGGEENGKLERLQQSSPSFAFILPFSQFRR